MPGGMPCGFSIWLDGSRRQRPRASHNRWMAVTIFSAFGLVDTPKIHDAAGDFRAHFTLFENDGGRPGSLQGFAIGRGSGRGR
jgi:hypothetical protein